jgi:hypothetical protein
VELCRSWCSRARNRNRNCEGIDHAHQENRFHGHSKFNLVNQAGANRITNTVIIQPTSRNVIDAVRSSPAFLAGCSKSGGPLARMIHRASQNPACEARLRHYVVFFRGIERGVTEEMFASADVYWVSN